MVLFSSALVASLLLVNSHAVPLDKRDDDNLSIVQGLLGTDGYWNDYDGGTNTYIEYTGNGSRAHGWPGVEICDLLYKQPNNNAEETEDLYDAIKQVAHETRVDHRFILAAVIQETKGCVRAMSSVSPDGIHNPGLLQDFKGTHTCNDNNKVLNPCPREQIIGMIRDGVAGTDAGHGFAEDINYQKDVVANTEMAEAYYRAARLYNSGIIDPSNDLGKGGATHCYSSDIANRLMGWTDSEHKCTLDDDNPEAHG